MYPPHRALFLVVLVALPTAASAADLVGPYAPDQWQSSGINGGTAEIDLSTSNADELHATYAVSLGSGGVSYRTAEYTVEAATDSMASFDWSYTYFHAWFAIDADLVAFYIDDGDVRHEFQVNEYSSNGSQTYTGTVVDMPIYAGKAFGIEVGGSNFDSNSTLNGTVILSSFAVELPEDCNGVVGGDAVEDMCGTCDADPTNDCTQDCNSVWGGTAALDMCGTCDEDTANDCTQDCNSVWGGTAALDMCGTCDEDSTNDCTQDCAGTWGGTAALDMCGTCDEDSANDCVQDCNEEWGGTAAVDSCGTCSGGTTGVEVDDCDTDLTTETDDTDSTYKPTGCGCSSPAGAAGILWTPLAWLGLVLARRRSDAATR